MVLFQIAFRPFFLAASLYAVLAVFLWLGVYALNWPLAPAGMSIFAWHAHEMIFGYSLAVVAGFTLTAVKNWTGQETISGLPLAALVLVWCLARFFFFFDQWFSWQFAFLLDALFTLGLLLALLLPLLRAKYRSGFPLIFLLCILLLANGLFFIGLGQKSFHLMQTGTQLGLYVLVALILMVGRRVIPFFIERGLSLSGSIVNLAWVDRISIPGYLLFVGLELIMPNTLALALVCLLMVTVLSLRLIAWYQAGIRTHPLLWILFAGYGSMVLGFLLKGLSVFLDIYPFLSLHAFAYGGVGLTTLGMMARVAWGHTGHDVRQPDPRVLWSFSILFIGFLFRVLVPLLLPQEYRVWIVLSQLCWISAFLIFLWIYVPVLLRPRATDKHGNL